MVEDIATKHGSTVVRTKVGEVNVSERMKKDSSVIGGEGNGGVIYPKIGYGRDSIAGIGLILDLMASTENTISQLISDIPRYEMIKDKITMPDPDAIKPLLEKVKDKYSNEAIDYTDGIKIDFADGWVHIRGSNTEPIVRIIAEGKDIERSKSIIADLKLLAQ